jgi:hypothetical protein
VTWFEKGSHGSQEDQGGEHTGKSGITPVIAESRKRRTWAAEARWEFEDKLERYQRHRFFGFTAHELNLMDCSAALKSDQLGVELNNPHSSYFREGAMA